VPDRHRARIDLPAGRSTLVVKVHGKAPPAGFYAWIAGGKTLKFEPTTTMAFVSGDPETWVNADVVIEAEDQKRIKGVDLITDRNASAMKATRIHPAEPWNDRGIVGSFRLEKDLKDAWVMVRYGHRRDTAVAVVLDGAKPVEVKLPSTAGWRRWKTVMVPFGTIKKGAHNLHVYATVRSAFHLDAVVFARGQKLGDALRK